MSKNKNETVEFEGKEYQVSHLKIQNTKELESLIEDVKGKDIYLTGTPVHSYFASKKSSKEINVICLISILGLIVLSKIFFRLYTCFWKTSRLNICIFNFSYRNKPGLCAALFLRCRR